MKFAAFVLFALGWLSLARADLTFEKDRVEIQAKPEEEEVTGLFPFKNTGATTVEIMAIESNCGCLAAGADKTAYAPGESGVMKAVFNISNLAGPSDNSLFLPLKGDSRPEAKVTIAVDVPVFFKIEPKLTNWKIGDKPEPKSLLFKVLAGDPVAVTNIICSREGFTVQKEVVKEGREYRITITPNSTAQPIMGALKIETDSKIPRYKKQMAFFAVRKPYKDKDGKDLPLSDPEKEE